MKVLIIEDDTNLREGLELLFEMEGHATRGTPNGATGIRMAMEFRPDIILTNFQMPGADGLSVLHSIRSNPQLSDTPVVFLTASRHPSVREQAARDGADAFINKPFNTEELILTVTRLLARSHQEVG